MDKLVLFPRKTAKPKKGLVNDASQDVINNLKAVQNLEKGILPLPKLKLREKPLKLAEELKKAQVYRKLRQDWANKRWAGKRANRKEEAPGKKK